MLSAFVNWAKPDLLVQALAQWCKQKPLFLHLATPKGGTKSIAHFPIAEGLGFQSLDRRVYDCKLRNKKRFNPSVQ
jgi:hypothetical protein